MRRGGIITGLDLPWNEKEGKKQNTKKGKWKRKRPLHMLFYLGPLQQIFDTREERGKGRREKMRERGLLCPCISSLLSALPSPDVAIAKPVGRRECVLGRGLAGLGGRRWWSNTWPSHKHEWPLQFNSSWCCLSHGAIKRGTGGSWVSYKSYNALLLQCFTHSFIVIVTEAKNGVSWRKDPSRGVGLTDVWGLGLTHNTSEVTEHFHGSCTSGLYKVQNRRIVSLSIHECDFELNWLHPTGSWTETTGVYWFTIQRNLAQVMHSRKWNVLPPWCTKVNLLWMMANLHGLIIITIDR